MRAERSFPALRIACLATVAIFLFEAWQFHDHLVDDTFISLRYARNLADGLGAVFNRGEYVEGYTNPTFVLFSALCFRAGIDPIPVTRALSLISTMLVLLLVRDLERIGPRRGNHMLAPYLALAGPAIAYWAVASFETMPFAALFLGALWLLWREGVAAAGHRSVWLWLSLSWTRPEGPFLFAVSTISFAFGDWLAGAAPRGLLRRHVANVALFVAGIVPFFSWRWWYYGDLLPNTFHAKVTGGSEQILTGLRGTGQWAAAYPLHAAAIVAAFFFAGIALAHRRTATEVEHPYVPAIGTIAVVYLAYIVAIGGDFMPYFRFFQPLLPLCSLLLAWTLTNAAARWTTWPTCPAIAALVATLVCSHLTAQRLVAFVSHRTTLNGARVGEMWAEELDPEDWIAVNTAGAIPFFSRLPAIDTLGLTDAAIARRRIYIVSTGWAGHRKGWGRYVLHRRPKRILWYNTAGSREPFYLGDHQLADSPYFRLLYSLKTEVLPARSEPGPIARFAGEPFGEAATGRSRSPELGFDSQSSGGYFPVTTVYEAPLVVNMFERDDRLESVRLPAPGSEVDVETMIDQAIVAWSGFVESPVDDPARLREVEALCSAAQSAVQNGDLEGAKRHLAAAAAMNRDLRSPLVYQYVANVAVLTGEPMIALAAQKEALRLQPRNPLYRRNLAALLVKPYDQLARAGSGD